MGRLWPKDYLNQIINSDCIDVMREMPDKCVDLVLTDPPYGLGDKLSIGGDRKRNVMKELYLASTWEDVAPRQEYFDELFRVSKNQIICGGNYFKLPPCRGFIVWDKVKFASNYSQVEFIWSSFDCVSTIFKYCSNGGFVAPKSEEHVHPTQKPTALFEWILKKHSKPGDIILDPFLGSGTTVAACINLERQYIGIEISPDYVLASQQRIKKATEQRRLFL